MNRPRPPKSRGGPHRPSSSPPPPPKGRGQRPAERPRPQGPSQPEPELDDDFEAPAADKLTLFGETMSRTDMERCFTGIVTGKLTAQGTEPDWDRIEVRSSHGMLGLAALRPPAPAAEGAPVEKSSFGRIQAAMTAITKIARDANPKSLKKVAELIQSAEFIVAVTAEPRLKSVPGALDALGLLVHEMNALVFTGETFEDSRGRVLLSLPGDDDDDDDDD